MYTYMCVCVCVCVCIYLYVCMYIYIYIYIYINIYIYIHTHYAQNDILVVLETGHSTALLLLDLSAAFDSIDHNILIHHLQH